MGAQQQRAVVRTAFLGTLGLAFVGFVVYLAFTAHQGLPFRTTTTVRAAFHDVGALHTDSQVRQNSLRIGRVAEIEYADDRAVVTLELDGEREVFADAHAAVWDFSALGQKFVEFSPGSPQSGALGDRVIDAGRNGDAVEIGQVLNVFDPTTLSAATSATRALGLGAAGHGPGFQDLVRAAPQLLPNTGRVAEVLAAPATDLPALLRSADTLSSRLVSRQRQISEDIGQTDVTLRALNVDNGGPLAETLNTLPATLDRARQAFDRLNDPLADTATFFGDFRSGSAALARSEDDLRGALREAPHPLDKVPSVADDASPAVEDLGDTVHDARPLAPRLTEFFTNVAQPVKTLALYAKETASLWARLQSMTSENINGKHYGRTSFNVNGKSLGGVSGSTLIGNDPYPEPGEADLQRIGGVFTSGGKTR